MLSCRKNQWTGVDTSHLLSHFDGIIAHQEHHQTDTTTRRVPGTTLRVRMCVPRVHGVADAIVRTNNRYVHCPRQTHNPC